MSTDQSRKVGETLTREELSLIINRARQHADLIRQLRAAILADNRDEVFRISRELAGVNN